MLERHRLLVMGQTCRRQFSLDHPAATPARHIAARRLQPAPLPHGAANSYSDSLISTTNQHMPISRFRIESCTAHRPPPLALQPSFSEPSMRILCLEPAENPRLEERALSPPFSWYCGGSSPSPPSSTRRQVSVAHLYRHWWF